MSFTNRPLDDLDPVGPLALALVPSPAPEAEKPATPRRRRRKVARPGLVRSAPKVSRKLKRAKSLAPRTDHRDLKPANTMNGGGEEGRVEDAPGVHATELRSERTRATPGQVRGRPLSAAGNVAEPASTARDGSPAPCASPPPPSLKPDRGAAIRAGLDRARARGVVIGRPRKAPDRDLNPDNALPPAAPATASVPCRVCGEDDADERVQPDLHRRCLEKATDRALERRQRRQRSAELTRAELVARLARARGAAARPSREDEREPGALTADELDVVDGIGRGTLSTDGLGSDVGWSL